MTTSADMEPRDAQKVEYFNTACGCEAIAHYAWLRLPDREAYEWVVVSAHLQPSLFCDDQRHQGFLEALTLDTISPQ